MAYNNNYQTSDWNQQLAWDYAFNNISWEARMAQQKNDPLGWARCIESLYVHCKAILTEKEATDLLRSLNKVRDLINRYNKMPAEGKQKILGRVYNEIFDCECLLRDYVNKHNAFLRLKPKLSLDDIDF